MIFIQRTDFNVRVLKCFYEQNGFCSWCEMAPTLSEADSLWGRPYICTQFFWYLQRWILAVVFGDPSQIYTNTGFIGKKYFPCYNNFCISEHHNIYPTELFASIPQKENPFQLFLSPKLLQSLQFHTRCLPYKCSAMFYSHCSHLEFPLFLCLVV